MSKQITKGMTVCHSEGLDLYWVEGADGKTVCDFYIRVVAAPQHIAPLPFEPKENFYRFPNAKALAHQFAASGEVAEALERLVAAYRAMQTLYRGRGITFPEILAAEAALALSKGEAS
jgi:hypothetical protein